MREYTSGPDVARSSTLVHTPLKQDIALSRNSGPANPLLHLYGGR